MSLVVVGSIGLDSISTPVGSVNDTLGGSAIYASLSASYFTDVRIVGVVGEDFPASALDLLRKHNIALDGLEIVPGKTFRWKGVYHKWNQADTLATELNVFADFSPHIPEGCRNCHSLLLGNIHPDLQLQVLSETKSYTHVACDTMNYWISRCPDKLAEVIKQVHIVFMNEDEIRDFTKKDNIYDAARIVLSMGPALVVVKRGEYGSVAIMQDDMFFVPAYPLAQVKDPTGAGDSFAGAFMAIIENSATLDLESVKAGLIYGTIMAANNVCEFGVLGLEDINPSIIEQMKVDLIRWTR